MSIVGVTKVDVDLSNVMTTVENVIHDEDTMLLVHARFSQIIDPYVPYDTGYLSRDSVEISAEGVTYTADYAWKQYYGEDFKHKTEVHPLATAFWDKVAMETHFEEFAEDVKNIIIRRLNNG